MDRLAHVLNSEHALLITCGYGFGDEHINAILYTSLDNRNTTNVVVLNFAELSDDDALVQDAIRNAISR